MVCSSYVGCIGCNASTNYLLMIVVSVVEYMAPVIRVTNSDRTNMSPFP